MPHAETHAVLLPHTTACNEAAVGGLPDPIRTIFGQPTAAAGPWRFAKAGHAPMRPADLGLTEDDLVRVAEIAVRNP